MLRASLLPVGELVRVVHQVAGDELGDVLDLHGARPVPVVAAPGVVARPVRQQHVAQVGDAGVAGLDDRVVLAGVARRGSARRRTRG